MLHSFPCIETCWYTFAYLPCKQNCHMSYLLLTRGFWMGLLKSTPSGFLMCMLPSLWLHGKESSKTKESKGVCSKEKSNCIPFSVKTWPIGCVFKKKVTGKEELTNEQLPTVSYSWHHLKSTHMKCRAQAVPLRTWTTWCSVVSPDAVRRAVQYGSAGARDDASAAAAQSFQEDGGVKNI